MNDDFIVTPSLPAKFAVEMFVGPSELALHAPPFGKADEQDKLPVRSQMKWNARALIMRIACVLCRNFLSM